MLIRRHYRRVGLALTVLNLTVEESLAASPTPREPLRRPVACSSTATTGSGCTRSGGRSTSSAPRCGKIVLLSVIQVDSDQLPERGAHRRTRERPPGQEDLARYEERARALGFEAESRCAVGTDVV